MGELLGVRWSRLCWAAGIAGGACCCTAKICRFAYENLSEVSRKVGNGQVWDSDVARTSLLTCLTSVMFTMGVMCSLCLSLILMDDRGWTKATKRGNPTLYEQDFDRNRGVNRTTNIVVCLWNIVQNTGYVSLLTVSFLKWKAAFNGTMFEVSRNAQYGFFAILSSLTVMGSLVFIHLASPVLPSVLVSTLAALSLFLYGSASLWIAYQFRSSIISLTQDNNSNNNNPSSTALLNLVFKISILTMTAIISTCVWVSVFVMTVVLLVTGIPRIGLVWMVEIFLWFYTLDSLLNNVCLLCTMKQSQHYYRWIFGKIHDYFIDGFIVNEPAAHAAIGSSSEIVRI